MHAYGRRGATCDSEKSDQILIQLVTIMVRRTRSERWEFIKLHIATSPCQPGNPTCRECMEELLYHVCPLCCGDYSCSHHAPEAEIVRLEAEATVVAEAKSEAEAEVEAEATAKAEAEVTKTKAARERKDRRFAAARQAMHSLIVERPGGTMRGAARLVKYFDKQSRPSRAVWEATHELLRRLDHAVKWFRLVIALGESYDSPPGHFQHSPGGYSGSWPYRDYHEGRSSFVQLSYEEIRLTIDRAIAMIAIAQSRTEGWSPTDRTWSSEDVHQWNVAGGYPSLFGELVSYPFTIDFRPWKDVAKCLNALATRMKGWLSDC